MKITNLEIAPSFSPQNGVEMKIIGNGEKSTFLYIKIEPGVIVGETEHRHDHEQVGICLEGGGTLLVGDNSFAIESGTSWVIESNEVHRLITDIDEATTIIQLYSPPRTDYLERVT